MASSRGGERVVHQDYIARIRYSNALPPPSNPPKLLDIPNAGLASSHYVTSGFGARLAREQALNIEADAELGMPIDLVGIPGVFDGDERAIQAPPAGTVKLHPKDEALTRPLGSLGKPKVADGGVSFLRRTEYTASSTNKRPVNPFMPSANNRQRQLKRPSPEPDRDSPAYIKRKIESGFVAAKKMREGQVKHPTKRHLKLVSSMPVLPDLETFPDAGAYVSLKFATNPLPKSSTYDTRMMSGLLRPQEQSQIEADAYAAACEEWEANGQKGPKPVAPTAYDFYLADSATAAANFRKKLDLGNLDRHDESLYTSRSGSQGGAVFSYKRLRAYETAKETEMDHSTKYSDELLLTLQEGPDGHTVAYYLPVMARTTIQNQRSKNIARTVGMIQEEEEHVDQLDIRIEDPLPEIMERINFFKADPENTPPDNQDPDQSQDDGANGDAVGESDVDADGEETADQTMVAPRDFDDEEEDAEGEEEEDD